MSCMMRFFARVLPLVQAQLQTAIFDALGVSTPLESMQELWSRQQLRFSQELVVACDDCRGVVHGRGQDVVLIEACARSSLASTAYFYNEATYSFESSSLVASRWRCYCYDVYQKHASFHSSSFVASKIQFTSAPEFTSVV